MPTLEEALVAYDRGIASDEDRLRYGSGPLEEAIRSSPALERNLRHAFEHGDIKQFTLNAGQHRGAGGAYNYPTQSLDLTPDAFASRGELIFMLGHETEHALRLQGGMPEYEKRFMREVNQIQEAAQRAGTLLCPPNPPRDYTQAVRGYVDGLREEEAQAHIGGFNALVSYLTEKNGGRTPFPLELYEAAPGRMRDFIECVGAEPNVMYRMKQGLTRGQDGLLAPTEENIGAVQKYFVDRFPGTFGDNGLLDYRHHGLLTAWKQVHDSELQIVGMESARRQGDAFSGRAAYAEVEHQYCIDFGALGANPAVVDTPERGVVRVIDHYAELRKLDVSEAAQDHPDRARIDRWLNPAGAAVREEAGARRALQREGLLPAPNGNGVLDGLRAWAADRDPAPRPSPFPPPLADRAHPPAVAPAPMADDHPLMRDARARLLNVHGSPALIKPERFDNVAAALALQAHRDGLHRIDHIVWNRDHTQLIAIEGRKPEAADAKHAAVVFGDALGMPARQSLDALAARAPLPAPAIGPAPSLFAAPDNANPLSPVAPNANAAPASPQAEAERAASVVDPAKPVEAKKAISQ